MPELTALLGAARQGDSKAAGEAFSLLYDDLRKLARSRLRQHRTITLLDTTSLVHESYLKLVGHESLALVDFGHDRARDRRGPRPLRPHGATLLGKGAPSSPGCPRLRGGAVQPPEVRSSARRSIAVTRDDSPGRW